MAYVELKNVTAGYTPGEPVLSGFNLNVEQGELLSLLGPSGCGKTTTLRTIAGFLMAQEGQVIVNGKDYTGLPPNKRNIGLVFQTYALFPHLSVFDNVAYGLRRRRVAKAEIADRVGQALSLVSLTGFEARLPAQLSGGQRQRVALARAVVIEPDLLLLDEPLSNLDAKLRDEMRGELSRLQKTLGITMIYVTHDQIEALSLSSRIVIMNQGVIEQNDRPETVYQEPATPFVAHFMGFDNSVSGTWIGRDGAENVVSVGGRRFRCSRPVATGNLTKNQTVKLLFRPQDVSVLDGGEADASADNTLSVRVEFSNYQGTNTMVGLMAGDQRITASVDGAGYPAGTELLVRIEAHAIILDPTPQ
jgi:putative spermidine/putrescine transport system ATP-binding protein